MSSLDNMMLPNGLFCRAYVSHKSFIKRDVTARVAQAEV